MKNLHYLFCLGIAPIMLFSCSSSNKLQVSKVYELVAERREATPIEAPIEPAEKFDVVVLSPPKAVEKTFRLKYPKTINVEWTKNVPLVEILDDKNLEYKASFIIQGNKNAVIYSKDGLLLETRSEISNQDIPIGIADAIENKYPGSFVVEVGLFKSTKVKGNYTALITQKWRSSQSEFVLMKDGTFVE